MGNFHVKLKVSFEFFTRDFPWKKIKWKKFLKGFLWKNPRASLARAAFKRDFLDNHGGRRSIAGMAQATLPPTTEQHPPPRTSALS